MPSNQLDIITIGDTVVDAFIKLVDAHLEEADHINYEDQQLCMPFASKVPYESVTIVPAVGNSANAAVACARLGLSTAIVTFLGNDVNGKECKFALEGENISTDYITMETGKFTNYHYVLWFKDDRTILIKHEEFRTHLPDIKKPKWIYLSSLGENAKELNLQVAEYIKANPDVKLSFQPGTFQIKLGTEYLKDIYANTTVFVCNVEEAMKILNVNSRDLPTLLNGIENLGPKIICITDGKNGSYLRTEGVNYFMEIYPDEKPPYERTGAGDAFASTLTAALALDVPALEAIRWAPINSMNVVQYIGAQKGLLNKSELIKLLGRAPLNYQPVKL